MIVYYWDAGMKRSDSYSSVTTSGKWLLGCPTDLKGYDLPLVIICKLENLLYITEENMQSLEQSCRKASEFFTGMADRVSIKKNKKFCYEMSLDMYAAATWIENMRKVEFYFAQMFPEEYEKTLRQMQEDTEKEFKYE